MPVRGIRGATTVGNNEARAIYDATLEMLNTIVKLNGVLVTDYDGVSAVPPKNGRYEPDRGPRPDRGYIAVQHHGGAATVWYNEISLIE